MPVSKVLSSALLAIALGGSGAWAQGIVGAIGSSQLPAEFPPASFKGTQYVDSKGCIYIRAGVAGNVTWVPRVTRARQPICGMQPTFAKAAPKQVPDTKVAQAPAPKPVAKPTPSPKQAVVAAKPTPQPAAVPVRSVAVAPAPVVVQKPAPVETSPRRTAPMQLAGPAEVSSCSQLGASARYMQGSGLRCGPQAESPVTYGSGTGRVSAAPQVQVATASTGTRIEPKQVYQQQAVVADGVRVPEGYRPVWKDGRLNPNRGPRTAAGKAQMGLIWTETVPRRLIDQRTGQDVTRSNPNLVYPYTDLTTQQQTEAYKYMNSVSRVSSKGGQGIASGHKYVQVGTFGVAANAQRTAARLQQAGLPVRTASYAKGGKQYSIVMAGPFASGQDLSAALTAARGAGFRDAFIR